MSFEEKIIYSLPGVYDQLEHTGDVYIRARGIDLLRLLENSGLALFDVMVDTKKIDSVVKKNIIVEGFDIENLLYKWLESLLFLYYSENLVCNRIDLVELNIKRIDEELSYIAKGEAYCEKFDADKHEPRVEVKSPTYSLMKILKNENEWLAYFVLDI